MAEHSVVNKLAVDTILLFGVCVDVRTQGMVGGGGHK